MSTPADPRTNAREPSVEGGLPSGPGQPGHHHQGEHSHVGHHHGEHSHVGHHHGGHSHVGHGHSHGTAPRRALTLALMLTATFMLVEAAVGWWTQSLALMADALHMAADAGALALALVAQRWAAKPRTSKSTYGFKRAEVLAAFINGATLAATAAWVVKEAFVRWFEPREVLGMPMLITAILGLVLNGVVAAILARAQAESLNVRAALAHVLADALGSLAAIVAGICVVYLGFNRADPLLSAVIASLVAYSGFRILKDATAILLEAAPEHLDVAQVARSILSCKGVAEVHDLHIWRISDNLDVLTVHVTLEAGAHGTDVCRVVSRHVQQQFGINHVTVQPEAPAPNPLVKVRAGATGKTLGP